MAATDPQSLLSQAQCYNCFGNGSWPLIEVSLLSQWLKGINPSASIDPAVLLAAAGSYANFSAQSWLLKLGLELNIMNGVSPGTATDPQSLLNTATCFNCYGPGTWPLLYLQLLNQIALAKNPTAALDPQSLLNISNGFNNYSAQIWLIRLELLASISAVVSPSLPTDPASILSTANCFNCYGPGIWPLLELAMMQAISAGSGVASAILMESSGYVLTETGGHILLG